jgi:hypothetical protein
VFCPASAASYEMEKKIGVETGKKIFFIYLFMKQKKKNG